MLLAFSNKVDHNLTTVGAVARSMTAGQPNLSPAEISLVSRWST